MSGQPDVVEQALDLLSGVTNGLAPIYHPLKPEQQRIVAAARALNAAKNEAIEAAKLMLPSLNKDYPPVVAFKAAIAKAKP